MWAIVISVIIFLGWGIYIGIDTLSGNSSIKNSNSHKVNVLSDDAQVEFCSDEFENIKIHKFDLIKIVQDSKININDEEILKFFQKNRNLYHRIFLPIMKFISEDISFMELNFFELLRYGFAFNHGIESQILEFANNVLVQEFNTTIYNDCNKTNSTFLTLCLNKNRRTWNIEKDCPIGIKYNDFIFSFLRWYNHKNSDNIADILYQEVECYPEEFDYVQTYLNNLFIMLFSIIIDYNNEIEKIETDKELSRIITNAFYKFDGYISEISKNTYSFYLHYMVSNSENFSEENYRNLLLVYSAEKQKCTNFLEVDKLDLGFSYENLNILEITKNIIDEKLFYSFDIDELLRGIIYANALFYDNIEDFIGDVNAIPMYVQFIKTAKTKDELLNYDKSERSITIKQIDLMSGEQFEEFICKFFEKMNYKCKKTKASGDQGVDVLATKGDERIAIQAKCYMNGVIGNHAVMEVVGGKKYYDATRCMVITNRTFTKSARELADKNNVTLWDRRILIEKLKEM